MSKAERFHNTQYGLPLNHQDEEINVDLFAGGGGASTGLEMGLGRPVHIAINHNPAAISMHTANHPGALHLETDVWHVDPARVLAGRRIGWFHASPDCTHHSQAAGGQPRKKEIRDLSWVVIKWAGIAKPRVISLENVKQIRQWGPLVAKRCKTTGRVMRLDGTVAEPGRVVPRGEQFLVPDPKRKGQTWRRFIQALEGLGYTVDYWVLKNCNHGDPTSRERLYLVARNDGVAPIRPEQTHLEKPKKGQKPWRTAAECIDWSIPSQSIFERKRPLADATLRRIARGIQREVIERAQPFIVSVAHGDSGGRREYPVDMPLGTVPCTGKYGLVSAFLAQANGGFNATHSRPADQPMTTITNTGSQQQLVTAFLAHFRGNCDSRAIDEPLRTVSAGGQHHGLVEASLIQAGHGEREGQDWQHLGVEGAALRCAAFLVNYYGNGDARSLERPLDTITTRDRLALVTVWIGGDPFVIVDICLRMLQPRELYLAQGFPPNYIIDRGHDGRRLTKTEQVHMCGNSVSPGTMAAIAEANNPWASIERRAAA